MSVIEQARKRAEAAQAEYEAALNESRQSATVQLAEYQSQLTEIMNKAKKLAADNNIVFYYYNGYEEFGWANEEDWNSSNMYC